MDELTLAIDGGGTRTGAVLFDHTGRVKWKAEGGHSNPNACADSMLRHVFGELLEPAAAYLEKPEADAGLRIFAGISGCSHPASSKRLCSILGSLFPNTSDITVTHDGINALFRGTHGRPGIVAISGTGSLIMAKDQNGDEHRVGGWGYLMGDEGSGYDIGRRAVKAVLNEYDGMGPRTGLTAGILSLFQADSPPDMIPVIYEKGRSLVASFAPLVEKAAVRGDGIALEIINASAASLAAQAAVMLKAMHDICPPPVPVILSGGNWRSGRMVRAFTAKCTGVGDIRWIIPQMPPVYGAAVQAMTDRGILPTYEFASNFAVTFGLDYRPKKGEWPWIQTNG